MAWMKNARRHTDLELPNTVPRMYRWLHLLDMAIIAAMPRKALTPDADSEVAQAVLRYFIRRHESTDVNRDQTDLVATFLERHPRRFTNRSGSYAISCLSRQATGID